MRWCQNEVLECRGPTWYSVPEERGWPTLVMLTSVGGNTMSKLTLVRRKWNSQKEFGKIVRGRVNVKKGKDI